MAEKRKRPTRKELDERLHIALDDVPSAIDGDGSQPEANAAGMQERPRHWTRIVSGRITAAGNDS